MDKCPDYSYLNSIAMTGLKPCPTLTMKKLAMTTLRKVDTMTSWIGDKKEPREEDASRVSRKLSVVARTMTPDADYAMMTRTRAATGFPTNETIEPMESSKEDVEVGSTELLPRRAAAAKLSAKRTKLPQSRQAASRLGLGYKCGHDDCSPEMMRCSPQQMYEMYGCPKMYEKYGCPEMTAATENHERLDTTSPFPPVEDCMEDYKVFGASTNLTTLQPGRWSISSSVQCCQAALQLQTLVPCGARSSAAAYCCALQRFAEQASVDCEPAQHQALRHHTWPGAARCVGKTDPPRPVKRGDSDSRKIHGHTEIPEQFQQVVS